ncbi:hypothetical protein HMPREF0294_1310, partial [Corynebacterium glucuronolyticum ATCC 51867]
VPEHHWRQPRHDGADRVRRARFDQARGHADKPVQSVRHAADLASHEPPGYPQPLLLWSRPCAFWRAFAAYGAGRGG